MQMQVIDGLSAVVAGVDDDAKTVVEVLLLRDFVGCGEELTKGLVGGRGVRERSEVSLGDDQQVNGCLWINVREREHGFGFIDTCDRDHTVGDLAEEAVGVGSHEGIVILRGYFLKYLGSIPGIQGL